VFVGRFVIAIFLLSLLAISHTGCFSNEVGVRYYGRVDTPRQQEFRWSDGGLPQIFDPAFAAAPPDTDLIRAIFEGLTEYDPRTLKPIPAVATSWESSSDGKVWTFYLRNDARWSNGEPVTAKDFIYSWQRTARLGDLAPHTELLQNIEGISAPSLSSSQPTRTENQKRSSANARRAANEKRRKFGAEAVNERVLRVHLQRPDLNFPSLVAHPVFRPVKMNDDSLKRITAADVVSNGAFQISTSKADQVSLARADNYWGKNDVSLDRVTFVNSANAESALAAYRDGEVDAVTNAAFEPLAIKLLAPFQDFRRATYGALTYYSFNTKHSPFDDVRIREALAIAIDRDRISQAEMGGSTEPAKKFLPEQMTESNNPVVSKADLLEKDIARARQLLAEVGYPNGQGFPKIRLLINRNEQQRIVSQSIAAMWRTNLNVETEIEMKPWDEYEAAIRVGDYDIVRRGLVMQTTDELTNIKMIFRYEPSVGAQAEERVATLSEEQRRRVADNKVGEPIESEEQALRQLRAVPIYFASSYALVKPYVVGFNSNVLDAPSLKAVKIDTAWKEERNER
jgi:oligopeptide transport system substrate-binding protein